MNTVKMQVSQHGIEGRLIDRVLLELAHAVLNREEYSANIYSGATHTLWLKMSWADVIAFFLLAESLIRQAHANMHEALAMLRMQAGVYTESEIRDVMKGLLEAARLQSEYSEKMWSFIRSHPWTIRFLRVHDAQMDSLRRIALSSDAGSEVCRELEQQEESRFPAILTAEAYSRQLGETIRFRFKGIGGGYYTYLLD